MGQPLKAMVIGFMAAMLIISGQNNCAHALSVTMDNAVKVPSMGSLDHHQTMSGHGEIESHQTVDHHGGTHHEDHENPAQHQNSKHSDDQSNHADHCPAGCEGGEGCQGCGIVSAVIITMSYFQKQAMPIIVPAFYTKHIAQMTVLLDPPPPKFSI